MSSNPVTNFSARMINSTAGRLITGSMLAGVLVNGAYHASIGHYKATEGGKKFDAALKTLSNDSSDKQADGLAKAVDGYQEEEKGGAALLIAAGLYIVRLKAAGYKPE